MSTYRFAICTNYAAYAGKRNVTVWRPSVCLSSVGILTVTHQGAACDAASVHFGPTIKRTDILVLAARVLYVMHALVSSGDGKLAVVVKRVPVMLRRMSRVPTPFQVTASHVVFHDVLHHSPREQRVYLALEERQIDVERGLGSEGVVEDGLLVSLAPAVCPVVVYPLHVHPVLTQRKRKG